MVNGVTMNEENRLEYHKCSRFYDHPGFNGLLHVIFGLGFVFQFVQYFGRVDFGCSLRCRLSLSRTAAGNRAYLG